ncbi:MAG: hypothetical protein PHQ80_00730 [Candidatus ainarchaeum sp.]|nr:hypothetical protein [Candidatus ainarchaeum sp.]MDD5096107.1 hypothetical protein [Candidatus ainarchaeum sp.]
MAKQRTIAAGGDLLNELEKAAGSDGQLKREIGRMRERFGGQDFARRLTPGQKAEILALADGSMRNWREMRRLLRGFGRGGERKQETAVASLVRRAKSSIKTTVDVAIRLKELAEAAKRNKPGMAFGLFVEAGEHYLRARFFARMARAGEMFAKAAALAKNKSVASGLRERAGDAFSKALDGTEGGYTTRHGDARKQYELAANLVRKTEPGRAGRLDAKAERESGKQDFVGTYEQVTGRPEPQYEGYLGY